MVKFVPSEREFGPRNDSSMFLLYYIKQCIATFGLWPSAMKQRPRQLAEAGFTYTSVGDIVQCFYCGGKLSNWEENDDPAVEHAFWIPSCQFMILNKGSEFIQSAKQVHNKKRARLSIIPIDNCRRHPTRQTKPQINDVMDDEEFSIDGDKCKICFDKNRSICLGPCGHVGVCGSCSFNLITCPICRTKITDRYLIRYTNIVLLK